MAAGQKIHITIKGTQFSPDVQGHGGQEEPLTTIQQVSAEYFQKGDTRYLFYEEHPEGFPAPLRSRIKLKDNTLEIHRQGIGGSTMIFGPGTSYRTEYPTPYGILLLDIITTSLTIEPDIANTVAKRCNSWPAVTIDYILQSDGEPLSRYRLTISETRFS